MSISALSSDLISDLSQQQWNPFRQIKQDFNQVASALQSGNLSDAQSAYASIQQLLSARQNSSNSNTGSTGSNTFQTDFATLGQALQSGDLTQAQSAFSQLKSDFQAGRQSTTGGGAPPWLQQQDEYVSSASQGQNPVEEALEDYTQLANALQSGNLSDAQSAYASLQQLLPADQISSNSSTSSKAPTTIQSDFAALGQALTSGNLTQAQSAFSQLQSDLQTPSQPVGAAVATPTDPTQNPAQQVRQDYAQLATALQSGNLTNARSAFTALEQALETQTGTNATSTSTTSTSTTSTSSSDPIANDLGALGQALSSGNLTQAQSTFSQLQSDIKTAQQAAGSQSQGLAQALGEGRHHHHHHGGEYGSQSATSTSDKNPSVNVYA
jgi:hypothetical protein